MARRNVRAAFYRGGTSKAVVFNAADLPADQTLRDRIFLHVMGSPDPYGRQLNGMGGGISSVSKVVVVGPSSRKDADVEYTFVQIAVDAPVADYGQLCGNMSSTVGPFAVEERLVAATGEATTVRVHNTNTGQIFHCTFATKDGEVVEEGDFEIPGVSFAGSRVKLEFLSPGGSTTGQLLPTGNATDWLAVEAVGTFEVSMVDASNPVVFLHAADLGVAGSEAPATLDGDDALMARMDQIRRAAAVAMGLAPDPQAVPLSSPKIALVAPATAFEALDGRRYEPDSHHLSIRLISMGNFHRAITLTGAMCVAVAARIPGTLVSGLVPDEGDVLIGNPSGVLPMQAVVRNRAQGIEAVKATTYRTQRRIMTGYLSYPQHLLG
ncbi:MAG: PrpF domain-containing protein [Pseudomonadota bacterium]